MGTGEGRAPSLGSFKINRTKINKSAFLAGSQYVKPGCALVLQAQGLCQNPGEGGELELRDWRFQTKRFKAKEQRFTWDIGEESFPGPT